MNKPLFMNLLAAAVILTIFLVFGCTASNTAIQDKHDINGVIKPEVLETYLPTFPNNWIVANPSSSSYDTGYGCSMMGGCSQSRIGKSSAGASYCLNNCSAPDKTLTIGVTDNGPEPASAGVGSSSSSNAGTSFKGYPVIALYIDPAWHSPANFSEPGYYRGYNAGMQLLINNRIKVEMYLHSNNKSVNESELLDIADRIDLDGLDALTK